MSGIAGDLHPLKECDVSRETYDRLAVIVDQIRKWQPRINLISPATLDAIWARHVVDSLQLAPLAPKARSWIDLGSGGGFPGLVVAAARVEDPDFRMILVESNAKKCAFLRETARIARLPVDVRCDRIENAVSQLPGRFDVVSARALAPLDQLVAMAEPFITRGAVALFPKGQGVDGELLQAARTWKLDADLIQSLTERAAAIVRIRSVQRLDAPDKAVLRPSDAGSG